MYGEKNCDCLSSSMAVLMVFQFKNWCCTFYFVINENQISGIDSTRPQNDNFCSVNNDNATVLYSLSPVSWWLFPPDSGPGNTRRTDEEPHWGGHFYPWPRPLKLSCPWTASLLNNSWLFERITGTLNCSDI